MAHKQSPTLILVAVLLLAAATPIAYGQLLNTANVNGIFCCTSTGTCAPGAVGVPGVKVSLNCTTIFGKVVTLAQNVTSATGLFSMNVYNLLGSLGLLLNKILPCGVFVNLPLNSTVCPILNTVNGTVVAVPMLVSSVLEPVLGLVGNLSASVFVSV